MLIWPLYGITRRLTERRRFEAPVAVRPLPPTFRRSLHLYSADVGNSNALNLEIEAMKTAPYNIHRFGIFFADTPRHADLLILLGDPLPALSEPFEAVLDQLPRPFGVLWMREAGVASRRGRAAAGGRMDDESVDAAIARHGGTLVAVLEEPRGPEEIIGVLRSAMKGEKRS